MHITNVLKKPILTEKSYRGISDGVYTFEVDKRAHKTQIKEAFEKIFEVKVAKINIQNYSAKSKRMGKYEGKTSAVKKALIKLKPGEKLDLFNEDN
ncbi:50S ribosomal protein L23 [Spiroplasma endosymbiont of Amphibalanus improvisus]|uniref:50S ribosomal protein L23 n=1 Tax=Spiroplasma endosymbiont of Amphibalanus improvisus TaxID=3066327 RepID=UPI00313F027F